MTEEFEKTSAEYLIFTDFHSPEALIGVSPEYYDTGFPRNPFRRKFLMRCGKPLREVWHPPESVLTNKCGCACGEMRRD